MLAHGEIVVAAPHGDVARLLAFAMQARAREGADDALQLGEHAVAAFVVQTAKMAREKCLVIHFVVVSRAPILVGLVSFPQAHFGRGLLAVVTRRRELQLRVLLNRINLVARLSPRRDAR